MTLMSSEREKCAQHQPSPRINRRKALEAAFAGFALAMPSGAKATASPNDAKLAELAQAYRDQFDRLEEAHGRADQATMAACSAYPDPPECIRCFELASNGTRALRRNPSGAMQVMEVEKFTPDDPFEVLVETGFDADAAKAFTLEERRQAKRDWKASCEAVRRQHRVDDMEAAVTIEARKLYALEKSIADTRPDTLQGIATKLSLWLFILDWSQPDDFLKGSPELILGFAAARDAVEICSHRTDGQSQRLV